MDLVEVPEYFLCPISLEIMKDPVTTATGITYDRESIERWLFAGNRGTCPVTNQPLAKDADQLTPNHTLRRLIQGWCNIKGVDRIPTPRSPVDRDAVLALLGDLSSAELTRLDSLKLLAALAAESESNRRCMAQCGVAKALVGLIVSCGRKKSQALLDQIELVLDLLHSLQILSSALEHVQLAADESYAIIESSTWIILHVSGDTRSKAVVFLRSVIDATTGRTLERLKPDVFQALMLVVRDRSMSQQATKAALHVLLHACPWGGNRTQIIEAGAVREILELELTAPDKRTTELNLSVLYHLCACAEGRAELLRHAAGIALVSKRILRVSPLADDQGVRILSSLCRRSTAGEVLQEMLQAGAVSKLCLVLQANCSGTVKERARGILRLHSGEWKHSPCIGV